MPQIVFDHSARIKRRRKLMKLAWGVLALVVVAIAAYFIIQSLQPKPMDATLKLLRAGRISPNDPKSQHRLELAAAAAARNEDKTELWKAAGGMAVNNSHPDQAENDYLKARDLGDKSSITALALANIYMKQHNDSAALKYYRLALESVMNTKGPYQNAQKEYLQKQIQQLEAKGVK
jgi:tetratricopeptide (TPR) repeat protein